MSKAKEVIELLETLKPIDKKVVDFFFTKGSKEGKLLSTDGHKLEKIGMGGQVLVKTRDDFYYDWVGVDDVKSTESIKKYLKKYLPSKRLGTGW